MADNIYLPSNKSSKQIIKVKQRLKSAH
jgi:hypothetical protein